MKELIEYVLAALIILSFIPVFDIITVNIQRPKSPIIESSTLLYISSSVRNELIKLYNQGNLTPQIFDIADTISSKLNIPENIGFNIKVESAGVEKVVVKNNKVEVYTESPGKLSICIVYKNLTFKNYYIEKPTTTYTNGTILYSLDTTTKDIVAVSAILETGVARYIGYWISPEICPAYILNINNTITLAIPSTNPPQYYTVQGENVVNASLIYYTQGNYYNYTVIKGYYIVDIYIYSDIYAEGDSRVYNSTYFAVYNGTWDYNGKSYIICKLENYYERRIHYFTLNPSTSQIYSDRDGGIETYSFKDVEFPIYNLVFIFLQDSSNKIYYAIVYPHTIISGENPPEKWIIYESTSTVRLGMINYEITITAWRSFVA